MTRLKRLKIGIIACCGDLKLVVSAQLYCVKTPSKKTNDMNKSGKFRP
jgi:hypothetical protein